MQKLILTDETSILSTLEFKKVGIEEIKQELQKNVEFSKGLTITDFEDKKQLQIVKDTKNGYVKTRNTIKRAFKSKRDVNTEENRQILETEREVIAVIELEEKRLDELVEKAELMKLKKENEAKLENRRTLLKQYEADITDEELLILKDKDFDLVLSTKKEIYLAKKEVELKVEQERINREKELEEAKKQARIEAEKEAQRQAELEKQRAEQKRLQDLENARIEKEQAIEKLKREQEEKELAEKKRKEDEENARIEAEKKEKEEKELLAKRQEFIKYRDSLDFDHFEDKEGFRIFYKKVGEFKLK